MNWFKRKTWKKIGEVVNLQGYDYFMYSILEHVKSNGDRQYKEINKLLKR